VPDAVLGLAGIAGMVVLLELLPRLGVVDPAYFPPFSEMMAALGQQLATTEFWVALGNTLRGWATGLLIAAVGGLVVGLIISSSAFLRAATHTTIEFLRPIPSVALIPLAVLLFGTRPASTLMLVVYATFWPILIQVLYGTNDVDPLARETAQSYHLSRWTTLRRLVLPTMQPYAMTGLRLGSAIALILEITGELIIGTPGLGKEIALAQSSGAVAMMYSLIIVTGFIGVTINLAARWTERRTMYWHASIRRDVVL
jgi:ABC-type nitrate/sulfonate/bicarbonate transport system permease component